MRKKKVIAALLAVLVIVSLTACGSSSSSGSSGSSFWAFIAIPLGWIMNLCYQLFNDVLHFPLAYVFAMLLFTIITKLILFPLSYKQQKSSATMAAFSPMMEEINKKYANNPEKRNEELQKLQSEYGYNPAAGCLPLLIQFPIIFGLVEVIYRPLTYMIRIPSAVLSALESLIEVSSANSRYIETSVIEAVKTTPALFSNVAVDGYTSSQIAEYIQKIADLDMSIGPINLWEKPVFGANLTILVPLFSIVTMVLSSIFSMKAAGSSGQNQGNRQMLITTILMAAMFAYFSFTYPMGFSLYWGFQNLVAIAQSFILKKMINADKVKAQVQAKIDAKREEKKKKRVITYEDNGKIISKEVTGQELARIRLQKAREIDEERYGESDRSAQSGASSKYDS
ncbi:MAG: YidC/Oxa1 family membrane protein insertase [Oscillospiraceae bacterium]|jgi:YidC/Oxa1 family membrane protein insertase